MKSVGVLLVLCGTVVANGDIQLFWSTTGINNGGYVYNTALTNFLPYFVPWTHPGNLASPLDLPLGTYDAFLWGQFTANSADYDTIFGWALRLTTGGSAGFTDNVAYRQRKTGSNAYLRWDGAGGIALHGGMMVAVTAQGIVNVPPDDPTPYNDVYIKADRTFLIGAARVTLSSSGDMVTAGLDGAIGIYVRDADGYVYDPPPNVLPAVLRGLGGVATGACCHGAPSYDCALTTSAACQSSAGHYQGDGIPGNAYACACPADANCDGAVNFDDINAFVEALSGGTPCYLGNVDVDQNGAVNFDDINPFVDSLSSGQSCS